MKRSLFACAVSLLLLCACTPREEAQPMTSRLPPAPPLTAPVEEVTSKGTIPPTASAVKVAILLPLSGDSASVGNAMLDAATMALSDTYLTAAPDQIHSQIILIPKDT